jgi:N-acetylglucosamine kinase-like BadF-type ATPase
MNAVGVGPDGAVVRFPALGPISGDWGGGYDVGLAALAAAARAQDGRGPQTLLATAVPAYFGLADPLAVTLALHLGALPRSRLVELPPVLFDAARHGDEVAGEVVLRLADEVTAFALAAIRRLALDRDDLDVVLGGGLLRAGLPLLDGAVRAGIQRQAPGARVLVVDCEPIVGAGLLALTEAGAPPEAAARLRAALQPGDER